MKLNIPSRMDITIMIIFAIIAAKVIKTLTTAIIMLSTKSNMQISPAMFNTLKIPFIVPIIINSSLFNNTTIQYFYKVIKTKLCVILNEKFLLKE